MQVDSVIKRQMITKKNPWKRFDKDTKPLNERQIKYYFIFNGWKVFNLIVMHEK